MPNKSCAEIQDAITDVLLLSPEDEIKVSPEDLKAHLFECSVCRAESVRIARHVGMVNSAMCPPAEKALSPGLFDRIMDRLKSEGAIQ